MDRTALYRHFDKDKNLLYVGISYNAFARLAQHEFSSTWAGLSVRMEIEYFDTRALAMNAEKMAIINEKPIHNLVHNSKDCDKKASFKVKDDGYNQINIRIRDDLVRAIKQQATENRRTMQAELEMILDEYFEQKRNQEEQQCNTQ